MVAFAGSIQLQILNALANQNRLDILACLRAGKQNVTELMKSTGLNQSTVSHSLYRLSASGLISSVPQNRFRYYEISNPIVPVLLDVLQKSSLKIA